MINDQLLMALDDKSKVAILADEETLDLLTDSVAGCLAYGFFGRRLEKARELLAALRLLRQSTFGAAGGGGE